MTKQQAEQYTAWRKQGVGAKIALIWAKDKGKRIELDNDGKAEVKHRRYDVRISSRTDESRDISYLGKFTSDKPDGEEGLDYFDREARHKAERNEYRYFVVYDRSGVKSLRKTLGRHEAWIEARREAYQAWRQAEDGYSVCMSAVAYRNGVELGIASLCGIEIGPEGDTHHYLETVAHDLMLEAVEDARKALFSLKRLTV